MNWFTALTRQRRFQQLEVDQLNNLAIIHEEDVNLAYCKRPVDEDIELFVLYLIRHGFKGINEYGNAETISAMINNRLDEAGLHTIGKIKLVKDITQVTLAFLQITQLQQIRLVLKVVSDDACRKFHTDGYDLRLLCTYVGSGTEWIEDQYVNRRKLMKGSNEEIIRDFSKIKHTEPFEVAILKGEVPSRPNRKGIVHRSPPIQKTDGKRLVLRLDY